uniref:Putative secreted protein n=1 Tax=Ixodes ricinus TaxID=34613 RepID=A0A6B0U8Q9_IXORI
MQTRRVVLVFLLRSPRSCCRATFTRKGKSRAGVVQFPGRAFLWRSLPWLAGEVRTGKCCCDGRWKHNKRVLLALLPLQSGT